MPAQYFQFNCICRFEIKSCLGFGVCYLYEKACLIIKGPPESEIVAWEVYGQRLKQPRVRIAQPIVVSPAGTTAYIQAGT